MSMLSWFKFLFKRKYNFKAPEAKYITIKRRNYSIIIPEKEYKSLRELGYTFNLGLFNGKPSCVQLFHRENGKQVYKGTLKEWLNVKSFKDSNVCNFKFENIIEKEENND